MSLAHDLSARGFAEHSSSPLDNILSSKRGVYLGIDPTADSLHVGHLVPILLMKRLGAEGHRLVFVVGGGTGMIGDPREVGERSLLDTRTLEKNKRAIRSQLSRIVGKRIELVDNASWLLKANLVEFLRDIGKHFTINELIKRDLIKRRLENSDESISFTEFSYSLLQGYDFLTLYRKKGINVQIGGSDQWTNMLSGVELIRRKLGEEAFVFTCPLVTDAAGKKFGKSEGTPVWLDGKKTSPFKFYQFWINLPDTGIETYLKLYTFLTLEEIDAVMASHAKNPGSREAQQTLARLVTEIVHGPAAAAQAGAATDALFGGRAFASLSREEVSVLLGEVPTLRMSKKTVVRPIVDVLVEGKTVPSKSEARRLIEASGVTLNGEVLSDPARELTLSDFTNELAIIRKGKRDVLLLKLT
ncbi:tyrosine--tRNA ligase [Patescibacteria group bacterium]|nr:tyrosine--tRNA ligase [Patescibacteria group bacterium]